MESTPLLNRSHQLGLLNCNTQYLFAFYLVGNAQSRVQYINRNTVFKQMFNISDSKDDAQINHETANDEFTEQMSFLYI